jgi:hypothetical protein
MKPLIVGIILGSMLTAGVGIASNFYDSHGKPSAQAGSIQSFDYFRQRQFYLDTGTIKKNSDQHPCGK